MKGILMENKTKVLFAQLGVLFFMGGLTKVVQKTTTDAFEQKWPTREVTAE